MLDSRTLITQNIMMILVRHDVSQEIINEVKTQLEVELSKCEVYERCTDLSLVDYTPFEYLRKFLYAKRIEGKSIGTLKRYNYEISKLLLYFHKPLNEYTTDDLRIYIDYRKYNGKNKKELSNTTINGMLGCYGSFFKWLTAERIIEWNPCLILSKIKCIKSVKKSYSNIDLQKLKEACKTTRDIALIDWLASTGCRISEVTTTTLNDIDWTNRTAVVLGKGNKERIVCFDEIAAMHLQQYLSSRNDQSTALFVSEKKGTPLTIRGLQLAVERIGHRAGVQKVHCHRFRHTLATNLSGKIPLTEVAAILGHNSISTTQDYCHTNPASIVADYNRAMA